MLRGVNPLLRSSARPVAKLVGPGTQRALTPRLVGANALSARPRVGHPSLIPATWKTGFSTKPPVQPTKVNKEFERELAKKKMEADPDRVSTKSSVRQFIEPSSEATQAAKDEEDVMRAVKSDLNTVAETFSLASVPREVLTLGLAGSLPYLATSLSTMYLSWNLNTAWPTSSNFLNSIMVSNETASHWLHLLEPIQLGYGAVIISFLGAVHWGLEFAERAPSRPRTTFRYGVGVVAPALAWPTLLLPVEWALIGQFVSFTLLYFADARAATRGWAPAWYGTYRFVLTFVVGSAIFVSLVGRAKIGEDKASSASRMTRTTKNSEPYANWQKLEHEEMEKEKIRKEKEEEEKRRKEEEEKKKEEGEKKKGAKKEKEGAKKETEGVNKKETEGAKKETDDAKAKE